MATVSLLAGVVTAVPSPYEYPQQPWIGSVRIRAKMGMAYALPAKAAASRVVTGNGYTEAVEHGKWFIRWVGDER